MKKREVENLCPYCGDAMTTTRMTCHSCEISVDAEFSDRPLARLPVEHQRFIEIFVLAGGSLKEIAKQAGVSYPTVRSRLDKVIEQLQSQLSTQDDRKKNNRKAGDAADILKQI